MIPTPKQIIIMPFRVPICFTLSMKEAGVEGTFILYDLNDETYLVYNSQRPNTAFIPASTYKIFNSLVALETKSIQDEHEIIEWDGIQPDIDE